MRAGQKGLAGPPSAMLYYKRNIPPDPAGKAVVTMSGQTDILRILQQVESGATAPPTRCSPSAPSPLTTWALPRWTTTAPSARGRAR